MKENKRKLSKWEKQEKKQKQRDHQEIREREEQKKTCKIPNCNNKKFQPKNNKPINDYCSIHSVEQCPNGCSYFIFRKQRDVSSFSKFLPCRVCGEIYKEELCEICGCKEGKCTDIEYCNNKFWSRMCIDYCVYTK